jgi:hypothetical protein
MMQLHHNTKSCPYLLRAKPSEGVLTSNALCTDNIETISAGIRGNKKKKRGLVPQAVGIQSRNEAAEKRAAMQVVSHFDVTR